jgi:hypothetical protein
LARIHFANASGPEPLAADEVDPEPVELVAVELGELPPHPVSRIPLASIAETNRRERAGQLRAFI